MSHYINVHFYLVIVVLVIYFPRDIVSFSLTKIGHVPTNGAAGFEQFAIRNKSYLISANFWDGVDRSMGAYSTMYSIERFEDSKIHFQQIQQMRSRGAHGADHFIYDTGLRTINLVVIPSYYGCERGVSCASTIVYCFYCNPIQNYLEPEFTEAAQIQSSGPSQTDHFSHSDRTYIVVAENFVSSLAVHQLFSNTNEEGIIQLETVKTQTLPVTGVAACAIAAIGDKLLLIGASYYDNGWETHSPVFSFNPVTNMFNPNPIQNIPTTGAHDVETIEYEGNHYLCFSEDRSKDSVLISSNVDLSYCYQSYILMMLIINMNFCD